MRLIPSPVDNRLLSCCMYDGARIIDANLDSFTVTRYFKQDHQSMCYGAIGHPMGSSLQRVRFTIMLCKCGHLINVYNNINSLYIPF